MSLSAAFFFLSRSPLLKAIGGRIAESRQPRAIGLASFHGDTDCVLVQCQLLDCSSVGLSRLFAATFHSARRNSGQQHVDGDQRGLGRQTVSYETQVRLCVRDVCMSRKRVNGDGTDDDDLEPRSSVRASLSFHDKPMARARHTQTPTHGLKEGRQQGAQSEGCFMHAYSTLQAYKVRGRERERDRARVALFKCVLRCALITWSCLRCFFAASLFFFALRFSDCCERVEAASGGDERER